MKLIAALILAFPEIIKLIRNIQQRIDAANLEHHVKEDIRAINKAFEQNDPAALKSIFNS